MYVVELLRKKYDIYNIITTTYPNDLMWVCIYYKHWKTSFAVRTYLDDDLIYRLIDDEIKNLQTSIRKDKLKKVLK